MTERRKVPAGSAKELRPLEEYEKLGKEVVDVIVDLCYGVGILGSIRRRRSMVRDVDIVLYPKALMWPGVILSKLKEHFESQGRDFYVHKEGPGMAQIWIDHDLSVDFWTATAENWGLMWLLKTGSVHHNIMLATLAKSQGKKLTELPDMRSEEAIFEELGLEYVTPEEREQ